MKRLSVIACALVVVSSAFAYYGDYGSSSDSGWLTFIGLIMIVGGILEIILFFKIWGMTEDIRALKIDHFSKTQFADKTQMAQYLRKNLVLGNKDEVKRILLQNFIDNVEEGYTQLGMDYKTDENGKTVLAHRAENLNKSIVPYVKNLMLQYAKIGEEVPKYIMGMETYLDYFTLFLKKDLEVEIDKK